MTTQITPHFRIQQPASSVVDVAAEQMRKFLRKKEKMAQVPPMDRSSAVTLNPHLMVSPSSQDNSSQILGKDPLSKQIDQETVKLRSVTQKLLTENVQLKERLSKYGHSDRLHGEPSWNEIKTLTKLVVQENDFLLQHLQKEANYLRNLRAIHLDEVQHLQEGYDASQMEKVTLEQTLQTLRINHDKLQSETDMLREELRNVMPVADHEEALSNCQQLLNDLKCAYNSQLMRLGQEHLSTKEELQLAGKKLSKLRSELTYCHYQNELLRKEIDGLKSSLADRETRLSLTVNAKTEAEATLRQMIQFSIVNGQQE